MRVHEVDVHPALPERLGWLGEIARNVWTSWNPEAQELFARLDPEGWEAVEQNPVALPRRLPQEQLDAAAADESFVAMVARVARRLDAYANDEGWFPGAHPDAAGMRVAYFSLEFGLDAGIPLYSGGLGILAGDHLKSASDLGVPLVGVGLLYARVLPPVARAGRRPARAVPGAGLGRTYQAGRPAQPRRAARHRRGRDRGRGGTGRRPPDSGRPGAAAAARLRRRGQLPRGARHHGRPLRRRPRAAHPPGDPARRRGRARSPRRASRPRSST